MYRIFGCVIASLLLAAPGALAQSAGKQFTVGTLIGSSYTNAYFGMSLNIPAKWEALGEAKKKEMADRGTKAFGKSTDAETQRGAKEALKTTTFNMLTIVKNTPDKKFDGNFVVAAERLPNAMDATTYLGFLHAISKRDRSITELGDIQSATIGGRAFATFAQKIKNDSGTIMQQQYYATIDGGHVLAYILTYANDRQRSEVTQIFNSIRYRPGV